ncbi:alpha/beta hydrolase [Nonomuraea sp. MCN248]|uniref:Alpha/beta hydrolase n=1 Tax=Nonomuraea corallina TaxID=2989783 RepID=A0ABT4S5X7_9ACTN|nr:alpha/beta hydrolase [Nonomuraea corallina]MDA0632584.1 alpha/beta hydrolase [Nonomuraea corallina]
MRFRHGVLGMLALGALLVPPAQSSGRLVRVHGEVATADRVAVIVPGADVTVDTFDTGSHRPGGSARALLAEAADQSPGTRLAVVAWLGYESPPTWSLDVMTDSAADEGARALRRTVTDLRRRTAAPIALLCHSYGSVVCAKAAAGGLPVSDLALVASPGLEFRSATFTTARVWAGLGSNDWMRFVPKTRLGPLGFGRDPMDPGFGARLFEAGAGGHSDYFRPGSTSLRNLTRIALGLPDQVTPLAPQRAA